MKVEADSHSTSSGEGSNADSGRGPSEEGENNLQGKLCLNMIREVLFEYDTREKNRWKLEEANNLLVNPETFSQLNEHT